MIQKHLISGRFLVKKNFGLLLQFLIKIVIGIKYGILDRIKHWLTTDQWVINKQKYFGGGLTPRTPPVNTPIGTVLKNAPRPARTPMEQPVDCRLFLPRVRPSTGVRFLISFSLVFCL